MNTLLSVIPSFKYALRVLIRIFYKATWIFVKEIYYIKLMFVHIKPTGTSMERKRRDEVCVCP